MFHICFAADENYIKYTAVLITSIVKSTDTRRGFESFFEPVNSAFNERERERERRGKA